MDSKAKQAIIDEISKMVMAGHLLTIKYDNEAVATILPVKDYQKFQALREARLKALKSELTSTLTLIRRYTGHTSLAEVEARLAALRHNIEQETEK